LYNFVSVSTHSDRRLSLNSLGTPELFTMNLNLPKSVVSLCSSFPVCSEVFGAVNSIWVSKPFSSLILKVQCSLLSYPILGSYLDWCFWSLISVNFIEFDFGEYDLFPGIKALYHWCELLFKKNWHFQFIFPTLMFLMCNVALKGHPEFEIVETSFFDVFSYFG
jgi:hypothetical protein